MYVHVFVAGSQVVPWRRGADADRGAYAARSSAAAFLRPPAPSRRCAPPPAPLDGPRRLRARRRFHGGHTIRMRKSANSWQFGWHGAQFSPFCNST